MHHEVEPDQVCAPACATLGVAPDAGPEEIRAAYLRKVQESPPERDPDAFERVRDAYRYLTDERRRFRARLLAGDPLASFASLLDARSPGRPFAGPEKWLRAIREGGS